MHSDLSTIGKKVKHADEIWEIIAIDLSTDKIQLLNQEYKGTIWVLLHEVLPEHIRL